MGVPVEEDKPPCLVKSLDLRAITCKQLRHSVRMQVAAALLKTPVLTPAFMSATVKRLSQQNDLQPHDNEVAVIRLSLSL